MYIVPLGLNFMQRLGVLNLEELKHSFAKFIPSSLPCSSLCMGLIRDPEFRPLLSFYFLPKPDQHRLCSFKAQRKVEPVLKTNRPMDSNRDLPSSNVA